MNVIHEEIGTDDLMVKDSWRETVLPTSSELHASIWETVLHTPSYGKHFIGSFMICILLPIAHILARLVKMMLMCGDGSMALV